MRLHRFIIENINLGSEKVRVEDKGTIDQIRKVLRLKEGDRIVFCDGTGSEAEIEIEKFEKGHLEGKVIARKMNNNEPPVSVTLFCAVLKKENFEIVCQKATEVGISKIVPVLTSRTVKMNLKTERLEKIIKEASEQSERGIVPKLEDIKKIEEAIEYAKENELNIFFDRSGDRAADVKKTEKKNIGIFIGPEGGWDESEVGMAKSAGFKIVSMGKCNLRAETAAIIGAYLALNVGAL